MTSISSSSSISTLNLTPTTELDKKTSSEARIKSATTLSVTPESQLDLSILSSLSSTTSETSELGFDSLVYNASAVISGGTLLKTNLVEEQIQDIIASYSPASKK